MNDRPALAVLGAAAVFLAAAVYFVVVELHRPAPTPALDVYIYFLPNKLHAVYSAWHGGRGLLWNPYQSCGEPFFANTAMGLLYPLHLLFLVLEPNRALHVVLIANMVIGATGMLLLLRQLGLGWIAAVGGALVFELGDPMSQLTGWSPMQSGPWAWLPWALLLCERLLRAPSGRRIAALAVVLTLELLPGWVLITALTYQLIALRLLWEVITVRSRHSWRPVAAVVAGLALAPCLAAVQLLPAAELAHESFRVAVEASEFMNYGAVMPDVLGAIRSRVPPVPFMAGALLLAVVAPLISPQWRSVAFYIVIGLLYGILALGRGTPLYALYAHLPPGAATIRYPFRLFWICGLCLAVLSAFSLDALASSGERRRAGWRAAAIGLAAALALFAFVPGGLRAVEVVTLGAIVAMLFATAARPRLGAHAATLVAVAVALNLGAVSVRYQGRLVPSLQGYWRHADSFAAIDPPFSAQDRLLIMSSVASLNDFSLMQKTATLVRMPDVYDYEALLGQRHTEYITTMYRGVPINTLDDLMTKHLVMGGFQRRLLDLAAVRYVVATPSEDVFGWGLDLPRAPFGDDAVRFYRNDHALARARYVPRIEVIPDRSVVLNRLVYGDDDLEQVAFVEEATPSGFTGAAGAAAEPGTARFVTDDPEHLVIEVEAPAAGFLVLADQFYPGWRATVNGAPVPIYRANYMFRLIEVPAGSSRVEFRYRPTSVAVGAGVSLAGLGALAVLLWGAAGRRTLRTGLGRQHRADAR